MPETAEGSMLLAETYVTGATISAGFSSDFDLSGISFDSTVADVANAFGEPYRFYCLKAWVWFSSIRMKTTAV